jgi:hypothetical protein
MNEVAELDPEFREKNLAAFRKWAPEIASQLERHTPASRLVRNTDGDWDVEFRGNFLYGPGGRARVVEQALRPGNPETQRIILSPLSASSVDAAAGRFLYRSLKRATDSGLQFTHYPSSPGAYHLVCFGLGLGYHLQPLIEQVKPVSICIVEPNPDFLYHSLSVMDWEPILAFREESPLRLTIVTQSEPGIMAKAARQHVRCSGPVAIDWTRIFEAYPSPLFDVASAEFGRDAHLIGIGLGFMIDEMEMTRASYMNMCDGRYSMFKRSRIALSVPVFVIGSGPSLDDDIDFIRENQDRAIIISCGTAARVLLRNGIRPDFQMLLENGAGPYRALEAMAKEHDFGDAVLIGGNTVEPRVKTLFKNAVFFYRPALSSYAMFSPGEEFSIEEPGPTVVNTGVSAALNMGFRELYLFGVDLGTRDKRRHHSKDSLYRHADDQMEDVDGAMDFDPEIYSSRGVGNFGGLIHTETIMMWTRDALTQLIGRFRPGAEVFNCSDGLLIENTKPMSSDSIRLKSTPADKARDLKAVIGRFPTGSKELFDRLWSRADWPASIRQLAEKTAETIQAAEGDPCRMIAMLNKLMIPERNEPTRYEQFFLRGSALMAAMCFDYYARRVSPPERADEFWKIAEEEYLDILRVMTLQAEWFFENIETFESDEDLYAQMGEWKYD